MPNAFNITDESKVKLALDYLDKEMTVLGVAAAFSATISGLALRELLLNGKNEHMGLECHPELIFATVGSILLLCAAIFFGFQRMKVASRFGDVCGNLLQPDNRGSTTELLMEPIRGWRWWRGYVIGGWLLALGLVYLTCAAISFILPADTLPVRWVWPIAFCPGAVAVVIVLFRKGSDFVSRKWKQR